MEYKVLFQEENEAISERHDLAVGRIHGILTENTVTAPYDAYFKHVAKFILLTEETAEMVLQGKLASLSLEALSSLNKDLYRDVFENYESGYLNPEFAVEVLGDYGKILSFLYTEIRGMIVYAFESRLTDMTILAELFIEIYNLFEQEQRPKLRQIKRCHILVYQRLQ